ncbi:MAG: TVP38/TMEM64 family protein [Gemmiger sp.]|nr:TVP38/TMEM64 family protein [Gemmiger sp.]
MAKSMNQNWMRIASFVGLALCVVAGVWFWQAGLLTSQEALRGFVGRFGAAGAAVFILFQAVQVVVPILPGGLGCLAGVVLFGPWYGFLYNYLGICAGSMAAFAIARNCGRPLLYQLFPEKLITRYDRWAAERDRFARWFAFLIFIPVAPDDYLCFLAGTTELSWQRYTAIILLCKPFSIALYSLGLTVLFQQILGLWK